MLICLIKYVENFLVDDQLFFHTHSIKRDRKYSFHWQKKLGKDIWVVHELDHEGRQFTLHSPDLITFINAHSIAVPHIEQCISEAVVNQVVFARQLTHEAEKIFGQASLQEQVVRTEEFYNELYAAISSHIEAAPGIDQERPSPHLSPKSRPKHLRMLS